MKLVTIVGARPQFIKSLPVSQALRQAGHQELVLHTGQHYDHRMSQVFFQQLGLAEPDRNLNVGAGSHAEQTAKMLVGIESYLLDKQPDAVVLYGDTNSTLAGALAAVKLGVPIAHVESGLRSFDRRMPEEINREVTDKFSQWLFIPTEAARANLLREGQPPDRIHFVGDVMYDIFLRFSSQAPVLPAAKVPSGGFVLVTIHRQENTDVPARLHCITEALRSVARQVPVLFPVHPRTRKMLGSDFQPGPGLFLIEPQGYLEMISLLQECLAVVTDSGGLQKEAFFARKPCVVVRDNTEWTELIEADWNLLAPPRSAAGLAEVILSRLGHQGREVDLYGGGEAATRIAEVLSA